MFKEMGLQSISHRLSTIISSASIDFIRFLREESGDELHKINNYDNKLIRKGLRRLRRMEKLLQKVSQSQPKAISNWSHYGQVHDAKYLEAKKKAVREFLAESDPNTGVVDLGANVTNASHSRVDLLIDQDLIVCRELWALRGNNAHVLQLDVAAAFSSPDSDDFTSLNLGGTHQEALALGLVHHLQIDAGLSADTFYRGLTKLYKRVLLEFPSEEDPMVQLLMQQKGEEIKWAWKHQQSISNKYLVLKRSWNISQTRKLLEFSRLK